MTTPAPLNPRFSAVENLRRNWGWLFALGIFLVLIGAGAIAASVYTTFVTIIFLGILLVVAGVTELIHSFWTKEWSGFFLNLLVGLFYLVTGALFLFKPLPAAAALTLLIGALFVVSGAFKIIGAIFSRVEHWGWILFSGIVSLILGIMILSDWPLGSLWIIGLFVGIDLIFWGWTWILLALGARSLKEIK
jgi:uncharacterized membrane protein HdeD (DUF308 family)